MVALHVHLVLQQVLHSAIMRYVIIGTLGPSSANIVVQKPAVCVVLCFFIFIKKVFIYLTVQSWCIYLLLLLLLLLFFRRVDY